MMRDYLNIMEGFFSGDDDCWIDDHGQRIDLDRKSRETHNKAAARVMGLSDGNPSKIACEKGWMRVWVEGQICFLECDWKRVSRQAIRATIDMLNHGLMVTRIMIEDSATAACEQFDDMKNAARKLRELSVRRDLSVMFENEKIEETYTEPNTYLHRFLGDDDFDYYTTWYLFPDWAEENGYTEEVEEALGQPIDEDSPEQGHNVPKEIMDEFKDYSIEYLHMHDPAELPSSQFFDVQGKMLPRSTWLVHFSNHASSIVDQGFTHGVAQPDQLGLTTYFTHDSKKNGGYNFAFLAGSRDADIAAINGKYGRDCVVFQNSGVLAYHNSDNENQVIFWGPDVDRRHLALIRKIEGEWCVLSRKGIAMFRGDFEKAVAWVVQNHRQYSRQLYI